VLLGKVNIQNYEEIKEKTGERKVDELQIGLYVVAYLD
jgi:hypothetical protein